MTCRGLRGASMALAVPLLALVGGCPGDDGPDLPTSAGSSDGSSTMSTSNGSTTSTDPTTSTSTSAGSNNVTTNETADTTVGPTTDPSTTDGSTTNVSDSSDSGSSTDGSSSGSGSSSGGNNEDCGNGVIDQFEDCEVGDLNGETCVTQGYGDGTLDCLPATCKFDTSGCFTEEMLQNDNGNCNASQLGCSNMAGTGGNPQILLECYQSNLVPPIEVVEVEYFLNEVLNPLPGSLSVVVHEWGGPGNVPGGPLASAMVPAGNIVIGSSTLTFPVPVDVLTNSFCVGLASQDQNDGFRANFTGMNNQGESWIEADACGFAVFTETTAAGFPGDFCIRPTVTSSNL